MPVPRAAGAASGKGFFFFRFAFPLFTEYNITKTTGEDIMKTMKHFFTLIEILTVAAIIAILAGISVGVIGLISNKNAEAKTQATIKALELALGQFKADNGHIFVPAGYNISSPAPAMITLPKTLPTDLKGTLFKYLDQKLLNSATSKPKTITIGSDDYYYFVDGWGRPLIYRIPGKFNKTGFDLGSAGPDGKVGDGGTGDDIISKDKLPEEGNSTSKRNYANFGQGDDITNFLRN